MKTEGDAGEGADVRVEEERVAIDEVAADPDGGSAEATGVEVDSDPEVEVVAVAVTVPTVRVKLAVTKEGLELEVGAPSITV